MKLRHTYSDFKFNVKSQTPVLPFTLTLELISGKDKLLQITIPNCLFVPFDAGVGGAQGRLQMPKPRSASGRSVPGPILGPDEYVYQVEHDLREHKEVKSWIKKIESSLKTDQNRKTDDRRRKIASLLGDH